ncbi:hypothetical protein PspLS_01870 [Pyricularia sp. CBS 133598]|nr:hypothetical protein PspLS_01870 [Pyricularia sp. CBS 133598]
MALPETIETRGRCNGDAGAEAGVKQTTTQCCKGTTFKANAVLSGQMNDDACEYPNNPGFDQLTVREAITGFDSCCRATNPNGVHSAKGGLCFKIR